MGRLSLGKLLKKFTEEEIEEIKSRYESEREKYNDEYVYIFSSELLDPLGKDKTFNKENCKKIGDFLFDKVLKDFKMTEEEFNNLEIPMTFTLECGYGYDSHEELCVEKFRYETEEEFLRSSLNQLAYEKERKERENLAALKRKGKT